MKSQFSLKKVSVVSAVILLLAPQAQALTTYTLTGELYDIRSATETGVTLSTPVTLELAWSDDGLVPAVGEVTVDFRGYNWNTSTLTIGNMQFNESPLPPDGLVTDYPSAHFVDGELAAHVVDGVVVSYKYMYWDVDVDTDANGTLDATLSCYVRADEQFPNTRLSIQVIDENSLYGDEFYGFIDFGVILPSPDGDADGDVDGIDVASVASTGGDLALLAQDFGQII